MLQLKCNNRFVSVTEVFFAPYFMIVSMPDCLSCVFDLPNGVCTTISRFPYGELKSLNVKLLTDEYSNDQLHYFDDKLISSCLSFA